MKELVRDAFEKRAARLLGREPRLAPRPDEDRSRIWALRDVSFEIGVGEVVGLVGHNGAGKSVLLKILSRITTPTSGFAEIRGRVGSLIEIGTGFHPELSGGENIWMNGAILGMSKGEVAAKFDEIVSFAGLERFVDTPVKHYSSGMSVRLGFSVAAHLDAEVIFLDEVWAAGDADFQAKSLAKISELIRGGRTVIMVSHSMDQVTRLCDRAIWLDHGHVVLDAAPSEVVKRYEASGAGLDAPDIVSGTAAEAAGPENERHWPDLDTAPRLGAVRLRRICVQDLDAKSRALFAAGEGVEVEFELDVEAVTRDLRIECWIGDASQRPLFAASFDARDGAPDPGQWHCRMRVDPGHLPGGTYHVGLRVLGVDRSGELLMPIAAGFEIGAREPRGGDTPGLSGAIPVELRVESGP